MSQPDPEKPLRWTATGIAFFIIGWLILAPSGLCTASVVALAFVPGLRAGSVFLILAAALFGGPFILLGLGFVRTGFRERKRG